MTTSYSKGVTYHVAIDTPIFTKFILFTKLVFPTRDEFFLIKKGFAGSKKVAPYKPSNC